jgi:hypothetical protein
LIDDAIIHEKEESDPFDENEILMQQRNMIDAHIDLLIRQKRKSTRRTFSRLRT